MKTKLLLSLAAGVLFSCAVGAVDGQGEAGHPRVLVLGGFLDTDAAQRLVELAKAEFPSVSFRFSDVGDWGRMRAWEPDAVVMKGPEPRELQAIREGLSNGGKTRFLVFAPADGVCSAERLWDRLEPMISDKGPMHLYAPVNFDPAKAGNPKLEDPLVFADGTPVRTAADWTRRRQEILDIFAREMLGRQPPDPEALEWEVVSEKVVFAGFARFRQVRVWFKRDRSGPSIDWFVFLPRFAKKPSPPILLLNYRGVSEYLPDEDVPLVKSWGRDLEKAAENRGKLCNPNETSYCPLPVILARGYAVMTACYCDVSPDPFPWTRDSKPPEGAPAAFPYVGVFELWPPRDESRTDNTTALGAWAWALSRGLDLAERMQDVDATRAVVTGCSRLGKAAFIAAARDERFKVCVANQCGGGGVTLAKRNFGESIKTEMTTFRHWYCTAYDKYVDNEAAMPFDQHLLVAAIAPRALLVQGFDDYWYDTEGEYLSVKAASPVWKFLGGAGLPDRPFPPEMDTSCIGTDLGYVRRYRQHGLSAQDWVWLLDFADRALGGLP